MNSIQIFGSGANSDVIQQIERTHQAARITIRPMEHNVSGSAVGGHYRIAARSGILTGAAIVAGAPLFSLRWADPKVMVLTRLKAMLIPTSVFTAAQELGLDAMHVTGFTIADSVGTQLANPTKMRQIMPSSSVSDIRIAAATLLTAGTRVLDANPFASGGGLVNVVNAAAATQYVNPNSGGTPAFGFDWAPNVEKGEYPLVLGTNEGILVRNTVIFPAAGTAILLVEAAWAEVASY
jgi:hypothetical protein